MERKPIVAGIGELLWDMLPSGRQPGGAPFNFAYHALQAGCDGFAISAIGKDPSGADLRKSITDIGLSSRYIQENDFPTGTVSVKLDANGSPDFTIHENVAWDHISWGTDLVDFAGEVDAVCFGTLAQRNFVSGNSIVSFLKATRVDCLKVFDINLRQKFYSAELIGNSFNLSDVLKLNENELPVVAGWFGLSGTPLNQLEQLLKRFNLKYVIYTRGSKGSLIVSPDEISEFKAPKVKVEDTVGAGDSFTAVFIAGILMGVPLSETHEKASEISAFVCTKKGATPIITLKIF